MTNYVEVLLRRHSGREWTLDGDNYENLTMLDGGTKPTKKSLDDAWPEVEAEIAAERQAKTAIRQSALAKLAALGLTDAEIAALLRA